MNSAIAVKGFIINNGKLLLIKRRSNDVHFPGVWEIPGGRLTPGEDPYLGLKREIKEESGLEVTVLLPLSINYFVRADGQTITAIVFVCKTNQENIVLSEEHTEYQWVSLKVAKKIIAKPMKKEIDRFFELEIDKKINSLKEPKYRL